MTKPTAKKVMAMLNSFVATADDKGKRLDVFLLEKFPEFSRSHIKTMMEKGKIKVNDAVTSKAGTTLKVGMKIDVEKLNVEPISTKPEDVKFDIVYQDSDLAVINKPQGLVVHPCASTRSGTLVNGLLFRIKDLSGINGSFRPGIVHRLDKDTSGLLVVAKNDFAHIKLAEQIKNKTCHRNYLAVLDGNLKDDTGRVETFIARDKKDRKKMSVQGSGRLAITDYWVRERFQKCCLVEFSLLTGRTHQIRVHAKYLGHPIIGDRIYGKEEKGLSGQLLHAYKLSFIHPRTNERVTFEVPLPDYFENYLKKQRKVL